MGLPVWIVLYNVDGFSDEVVCFEVPLPLLSKFTWHKTTLL